MIITEPKTKVLIRKILEFGMLAMVLLGLILNALIVLTNGQDVANIHTIFWLVSSALVGFLILKDAREHEEKLPKEDLLTVPEKTTAHTMIGWAMESALGFFIWAILFGKVVMPQWLAVSVSGWDTYSALLWGFVPLISIAAYIMYVVDNARAGYRTQSGY
jgi:hypothetical protein